MWFLDMSLVCNGAASSKLDSGRCNKTTVTKLSTLRRIGLTLQLFGEWAPHPLTKSSALALGPSGRHIQLATSSSGS